MSAVGEDLTDEDRRALLDEANERRELDDDSFFAGVFHAVVVLEEPEAHLHPQLQHGLVSYLKEVVDARPEVQIILTTHSDEIVAACDPEDLVVLRRDDGRPVARTIKNFKLSRSRLDQARRHLDVTRSASLFAERAVLVEGITDAAVLRAVARRWAGADRIKRRFVESLTISVVGSRVGSWMPHLLTRNGAEIVERLAVLRDTDGRPEPTWISGVRTAHFEVFFSDPTLEPAITPGNEELVRRILYGMGVRNNELSDDDDVLLDAVQAWFKKKGKGRKARFADEFAAACRDPDEPIAVPEHLEALLEFVWDGFLEDVTPQDEELGEQE